MLGGSLVDKPPFEPHHFDSPLSGAHPVEILAVVHEGVVQGVAELKGKTQAETGLPDLGVDLSPEVLPLPDDSLDSLGQEAELEGEVSDLGA